MSKFGDNIQMNMIVIKVEFIYVLKGIQKRIEQKAVRYTR